MRQSQNEHDDPDLLLDWPYAERQMLATLSAELIEAHGKVHLCRALNKGRAIAVVGSGVSAAYGRPQWSGILDHMRRWTLENYHECKERLKSDARRHELALPEADRLEAFKQRLSNIHELDRAWVTFKAFGFEKPIRPGQSDYTTPFQVIENLFVATRLVEGELDFFRDGHGMAHTQLTTQAREKFRAYFRQHFSGHRMRLRKRLEHIACILYQTGNGFHALKSLRDRTLRRWKKVTHEEHHPSNLQRRRIERDLLAPKWLFDGSLERESAIDDEDKPIEVDPHDFYFSHEFTTELGTLAAENTQSATSLSAELKSELQKWFSTVDGSWKKVCPPGSSGVSAAAIPRENLWFLAGVFLDLAAIGPGDQRCKLQKLLRKQAKSFANAYKPCGHPEPSSRAQPRTIEAQDPLSTLFRELDITRFMTTNYDLEIERMLEHHGFRVMEPSQHSLHGSNGTGHSKPPNERERYTNTTMERATSVSYSSRNPEDLIDFALDERMDLSHVVHLHGTARPGSKLAVTEADYKDFHVTDHRNRDAGRAAMDLAFTSNPLIFVGVGMSEPDILRPLRAFATDTERLSDRPVVSILARMSKGPKSLWDLRDKTQNLREQLANECKTNTAIDAANRFAEWGVLLAFYGTIEKEGEEENQHALAEILYHLARVTHDDTMADLIDLLDDKKFDHSRFEKHFEKLRSTFPESGADPGFPLECAFGVLRAGSAHKELAKDCFVERQSLKSLNLEFENCVAQWPEEAMFDWLAEDKREEEREAVCLMLRAYREIALGLEQTLRTAFLTAFLNRCASDRLAWTRRWSKFPPARSTFVSEPESWKQDDGKH